jgi:hypothetical protein
MEPERSSETLVSYHIITIYLFALNMDDDSGGYQFEEIILEGEMTDMSMTQMEVIAPLHLFFGAIIISSEF